MQDHAPKSILAIIDYGSGNLRSAAKAFEHVIEQNKLNIEVLVTNKASDLARASHIVLPGQGAFGDCMAGLQAVEGMIEALERAVLVDKKPFLGICVGMQLLVTRGLEYGTHDGLNWIEGDVVPMKPDDPTLKIPHMGWNNAIFSQDADHPVLARQKKHQPHFYFVHSFMVQCKDSNHVLGIANYGGDVTAIIGRDNILGVQFHPEKSQEAGLQLLHDFLLWQGGQQGT